MLKTSNVEYRLYTEQYKYYYNKLKHKNVHYEFTVVFYVFGNTHVMQVYSSLKGLGLNPRWDRKNPGSFSLCEVSSLSSPTVQKYAARLTGNTKLSMNVYMCNKLCYNRFLS